MAQFQDILPNEEIENLKKIYNGTSKIFGTMTKESAEMVKSRVISNMKYSFKNSSKLVPYLKVSKTYQTKSDNGINNKVLFSGYYKEDSKSTTIRRRNKKYSYNGIPVPLIVRAREFGSSRNEAPKPFFRRSFNPAEIKKIMLIVQKRESGGLLDE